jgi:hypothetical protein
MQLGQLQREGAYPLQHPVQGRLVRPVNVISQTCDRITAIFAAGSQAVTTLQRVMVLRQRLPIL